MINLETLIILKLEEYLNPPRFMKLIITESRMNSIVTKWLDKNYSKLKKHAAKGGYMYTHYRDDDYLSIFRYNRSTGLITIINPDLQENLISMFGVDDNRLNDIFIPWLKKTYNLTVPSVKYFETTYHCNECGRYHNTTYHIDD
jgi:hypothetical protein